MKLGQPITYVDAKGKEFGATVVGVPDTGASGKKILDITYEGGAVSRVVHGDDREKGKGFWLLLEETKNPPDRRAPEGKQPIALAEEEATGGLPPVDRRAGSGAKRTIKK